MPAYTIGTVSTANNTGTGTDFTANMPATFSAGDLLLGFTRSRASSETFTQPAGWTTILTHTNSNGSICMFAKIAVGGDSAPTISWSGSSYVICQIASFTGDVYTDLSTIVAHSAVLNGTATDIDVPALTVTTDNCLIVAAGGHNKTATSDGATLTPPGAYTDIGSGVPAGASTAYAWGYVQQTTAANLSATEWNISIAESLGRSGVTFALQSQASSAATLAWIKA